MKVLPKYLWEGYLEELREYVEVINRQVDVLDYYWQLPEASGFRFTLKVMLRYTLGMVEIINAIKDGTGDLYSDTLPDVIICEPSTSAPMSLDQFNGHISEMRVNLALVQESFVELDNHRYFPLDWQETCENITNGLSFLESKIVHLYMSK